MPALSAPPKNRSRKSIDDLNPSVGRETGSPVLVGLLRTESPADPSRPIADCAAADGAEAQPLCAPNDTVGATPGSTKRPNRSGARHRGSGYIASPRITAALFPANSL